MIDAFIAHFGVDDLLVDAAPMKTTATIAMIAMGSRDLRTWTIHILLKL